MSQIPQVYERYNLLFTPDLIPQLRNLRGEEWAELVDSLAKLPIEHPDVLAFCIMMIDLGSCLTCEMDSYRAQRGCSLCSQQSISRFKGSDKKLFAAYEKAQQQVRQMIDGADSDLKKAA